jgi:hypothetical protein
VNYIPQSGEENGYIIELTTNQHISLAGIGFNDIKLQCICNYPCVNSRKVTTKDSLVGKSYICECDINDYDKRYSQITELLNVVYGRNARLGSPTPMCPFYDDGKPMIEEYTSVW